MPDLKIVDSHVHIWDPSKLAYTWLNDNATLGRKFLLEDYNAAFGANAVEAMVFVECDIDSGHAVDEIAWVDSVAKADPRIAAYVAHAPVDEGDGVLATLEALQPFQRMRGVRRLIQSETMPGFCLQESFITGVRMLERFDWSFDICILGWQMEDAIGLVDRCPNVSFVLDHIGKPSIRNGELEPWRQHMRQLAERSNVVCKLSGVATEADHKTWRREELTPFIATALEAFGPNRLMFGGDWPVATFAITPKQWLAEVDWALHDLSGDERQQIYSGVSRRFYRF